MIRNSFKFLTLALAASLTVAPVSAIDWNSNSTRFGLAGLGFAVASLVSVIVYNYFSKKTPKQEHKPTVNHEEEKHRLYTILAIGNFSMKDHEVKSILDNLQNDKLINLVENLNEINKSLFSIRQNAITSKVKKLIPIIKSQAKEKSIIEEELRLIKLEFQEENKHEKERLKRKFDRLLAEIQERLFNPDFIEPEPVTLQEKRVLYNSLEETVKRKWSIVTTDNFIDQVLNRLNDDSLEKLVYEVQTKIAHPTQSKITDLNTQFDLFIIQKKLDLDHPNSTIEIPSNVTPIEDQSSVTFEDKQNLFETLLHAALYADETYLNKNKNSINDILEQFQDIDLTNLVNSVRLPIIMQKHKYSAPIPFSTFGKIKIKLGLNDNDIKDKDFLERIKDQI